MSAQYGEEEVIYEFFKGMSHFEKYLVDIGAADGFDNSNTFFLISNYGWTGILSEPNIRDYKKLCNLYKDRLDLIITNKAIAPYDGEIEFYVEPGQCSTCIPEFKKKVEIKHSAKYEPAVKVPCTTMKSLLDGCQSPNVIDFMSIDCEGSDMDVLKSMDWDKYKVRLICIEHSMPEEDLHWYMEKTGYFFYKKTVGNSFFTVGAI